MSVGVEQAIKAHLKVLQDSFERSFPEEAGFQKTISAFCNAVCNGLTVKDFGKSIFSNFLQSIYSKFDDEIIKILYGQQLLLECALYERILPESEEIQESSAENLAHRLCDGGFYSERLNISFFETLRNSASFLRTLKNLKIENVESFGFGFGDALSGVFKPTHEHTIEYYANMLYQDERIEALAKKIGHHAKNSAATIKNSNSRPAVSRNGVCFSKDLQNVLSQEFALLKNEKTKCEFFRKATDGGLLSYRRAPDESSGGKKNDRGPVVICLDTSGTMRGVAESISKAAVLAVASACVKEKRRLVVISFSLDFEIFEYSSFDRITFASLSEFLKKSFYGGTDFTPVLNRALKLIESSYRDSDILLTSDFIAGEVEEPLLAKIEKAKRELGMRLFAIRIGNLEHSILKSCNEVLSLQKEKFNVFQMQF